MLLPSSYVIYVCVYCVYMLCIHRVCGVYCDNMTSSLCLQTAGDEGEDSSTSSDESDDEDEEEHGEEVDENMRATLQAALGPAAITDADQVS